MRILCFLHSFEPGGVEKSALRLCARWQADGVDVSVLLGRTDGRMRRDAPALDYHVPPRPPIAIAWCETLWLIAWLPWALRRVRPDVLFCAGNSYTVVAVMLKLMLGRRCPPIVAKISNDLVRRDLPAPLRHLYHRWCRIQGRMIDRIVALSPAMRDEVATVMAIAEHRVSLIANPVLDSRRIASLAAAGRRARASRDVGRRFVAAGRLVRQKDLPLMITAFARGASPADRLVILGEGPERAMLERLIHASGLSGRVRLVGHSDDLERWFARSDVLLLSSRYEGLPGIVVEAMAAGLAVVATDCCASMVDLLGEDGSGTIVRVPVGDVARFAAAIRDIAPAGEAAPLVARAAQHRTEPVAAAYRQLFADLPGVTTAAQAAAPLRGGAPIGAPRPQEPA